MFSPNYISLPSPLPVSTLHYLANPSYRPPPPLHTCVVLAIDACVDQPLKADTPTIRHWLHSELGGVEEEGLTNGTTASAQQSSWSLAT